jgi:Lar family restriction alleviation protein
MTKGLDWLLPCPFCGCSGDVTSGIRGSVFVFYITCISCGANGEKFDGKFESEVKQKAFDAWNKRYEPETEKMAYNESKKFAW